MHVTGFERPEDGAWDTTNPNRFYFVTTASNTGHSKLWALDFVDAADQSQGGTIKLLVNGTEGDDHQMWDNFTVSADGKVTLLEDPGNNARDAAVWQYDPSNSQLTKIAQHDPSLFVAGGANFITVDEESSGVIDVSNILGNAGESIFWIPRCIRRRLDRLRMKSKAASYNSFTSTSSNSEQARKNGYAE